MARFGDLLADPDHNNQNVNFSDLIDTDKIAKSSNNTYSEGSSHGYNYEPNSLDKGDVTPYDLPTIEDQRAENQSTIGSLSDSFAKFAGKTVLSTIGNLAGTIYGVGAAIEQGDVTKIWDNSFMDAVDAGDKGLDNIFKTYQSSDYKDQNILQRLFLHPTQFIDEATDTASFMAGAVLSEIATSGVGSETIVPKALKYMKYLSEGAEASEATRVLTSFATKGITLAGDIGTSVKHLAMGASYEGIVEARAATMQLRDKMYQDYSNEHPNEEIPESIKSDIDNRLSKAGLFTYLGNLALVGETNLLLFPKLFGLGHETSKLATGAIEKNIESGLFESTVSKRLAEGASKYSLLDNITTGLKKPFIESTKFGIQGSINNTAKDYWDRKNNPDDKTTVSGLTSDFAKQLADTYTSKEGWNNIGMGMIIGALGAPGRGILSKLSDSNPLSKYGYKDITDDKGNVIGKEPLPLWTGGVRGSFDEREAREKQIGKVLNDLNEHTDFFKAAKANYDALVTDHSLEQDKNKALEDGDIFEFQNAKDDQIHNYVSSRIKNNLYDDLLSEVDKMKQLSPDEFYTNFKGEEASNNATDIEKLKFQLDTSQQFLEKANNTREAIKISDNVYRGDNPDLREELTHAIATSKNLDTREKLMNQSLSDLSSGLISNYSLRYSPSETPELDAWNYLKEHNPTAATLYGDKIVQLLSDSKKLRERRENYLDLYNHLFTQEGQKQFNEYQQKLEEQKQKETTKVQKEQDDKQAEEDKKKNIQVTVDKVETIKNNDEAVANDNIPNVNFNEEEDTIVPRSEEEIKDDISKNTDNHVEAINNNDENSINQTLDKENELKQELIKTSNTITPEDNTIIKIVDNDKVKANRELITKDTGLAKNASDEHYNQIGNINIINLDLQRTLGNTISYLSIDKIVLGRIKDGQVESRTFDTFDENNNLNINEYVNTKLFSQNYYKPGDNITFSVPTFQEMSEGRGLQEYTQDNYITSIEDIKEFPIAIKGEDGKIIGYLPTQSGIERLVSPEFRDEALASNLSLRESIFFNKDLNYKGTITSKSPGMIMLDKKENQKSLFEVLGDKTKLADNVTLGITKPLNRESEATSKDLYTDLSSKPFSLGEVVNGDKLQSGIVYAIVPSSSKDQYIVYPTKVNTIGEDNSKTIVEAIKLFYLSNLKQIDPKSNEAKSIDNIKEYNISNFNNLRDFVNRIMYTSTTSKDNDNTIFRLFKDNLVLSALDNDKVFSLEDISNSQSTRDRIIDILKDRYYSVGLENLNTKDSYISYSLDKDNIIQETTNNSYQDYLNDNKVITSNIRGVHIENNEYAFTAQPVIGISDSIEKYTKELPELTENKEESLEEVIPTTKKLTNKKLNINISKLKDNSLEDINPEFIEKNNIKSGEDLKNKCL